MSENSGIIGNREPARGSRAGYTLLELLIASVLLATLMSAVWNLMTMYSGFLQAGRAEATEQQLARSLLDLLSADIGSIVPARSTHTVAAANSLFAPEPPSGNQPNEPAFEDPLAVEVRPTSMPATSEVVEPLPDFAMRGGSRSLTLIVTQTLPDVRHAPPDNDGNSHLTGEPEDLLADGADARSFPEDVLSFSMVSSAVASPAVTRASNCKQIVYHFEPPRTVHPEDRALPPGLHRFEIPVEALGRLSELQSAADRPMDDFGDPLGGGVSTQAVEALTALEELGGASIGHEWIPEVVRCRFTYLAARGWASVWQSEDPDDRPVAVRIELGLLSSREQKQLMAALGSTQADPTATPAEDTIELSAGVLEQSDPFAAFHPRSYERMVVLDARPVVTPRGEPFDVRPRESSEFAAAPFDAQNGFSSGREP